jgi:hypothetical protein
MNKLILGLAALPLLSFTGSAGAQYYPTNNQNQYSHQAGADFSARIHQLRTRLQAGVQSGTITRTEAAPIREQLRQVSRLERQYGVNGLSGQERADLQQRVRMIRQQLRVADNGNEGRYAQWDAEDRYGQPYQQGHTQGYQQPYQQGYSQTYPQPVQQGGIAGILSQIVGGGGLQVGQRVSGNLYAVPPQHEGHYRDGGGVYYRSDGRRIYQIDARSQTVLRIFPI